MIEPHIHNLTVSEPNIRNLTVTAPYADILFVAVPCTHNSGVSEPHP